LRRRSGGLWSLLTSAAIAQWGFILATKHSDDQFNTPSLQYSITPFFSDEYNTHARKMR